LLRSRPISPSIIWLVFSIAAVRDDRVRLDWTDGRRPWIQSCPGARLAAGKKKRRVEQRPLPWSQFQRRVGRGPECAEFLLNPDPGSKAFEVRAWKSPTGQTFWAPKAICARSGFWKHELGHGMLKASLGLVRNGVVPTFKFGQEPFPVNSGTKRKKAAPVGV